MSKPEFIIFDCDGVLVDSEYLCSEIYARLISVAGCMTTANEMTERYSGLPFPKILKHLEQEKGILFSTDLIKASEKIFNQRIKTNLLPIDGIRENISQMGLPYCICSNSASNTIKMMLESVKIYDLFKEKIFSAPEVGTKQSKPAPDVFLYAAHYYKVKPDKVVVLEDSVPGVTGAIKAGMMVVGFVGGRHAWTGLADVLIKAGARAVIAKHADMKSVIDNL